MKTRPSSSTIIFRVTLLGLLGVISASCTTSRKVNYRTYEKMPSKPSTVALRSVLKTVPYTRKRSFYGNYGGVGCKGGRPTDKMDEYFRRHDVVYTIAKSKRTMTIADEELVKALKEIDESSLTDYGREYRKRAINFLESPMAGVIGKPVSALLRQNEPSGSDFTDPESVRRFFHSSHPGIPGPALPGTPLLAIKN